MTGVPLPFRPLMRYADFKGRSRRGEFWSFLILVWIAYGALYGWALFPLAPVLQGKTPGVEIVGHLLISFAFIMLLGILLLLPTLAVQVRRLHDSNRTGWWLVFPMGISMASQHLAYIFQGEAIMRTTQKASEAIQSMAGTTFDFATIWQAYWPLYQILLPWSLGPSVAAYLLLLIFYLWPGSRGQNRFGPDPRSGAAT